MKPTLDAIAEAIKNPNGWVYAIDGKYGLDETVRPHAIKGAWRVDGDGKIVGDFIPNPGICPSPGNSARPIPQ